MKHIVSNYAAVGRRRNDILCKGDFKGSNENKHSCCHKVNNRIQLVKGRKNSEESRNYPKIDYVTLKVNGFKQFVQKSLQISVILCKNKTVYCAY